MGVERVIDLGVDRGDPGVQGKQGASVFGHDLRGDLLPWDGGVLSVCGVQRGVGDLRRRADLPFREPGRDPDATCPAQSVRGLISGQQHDRSLASTEIERALQAREVPGEGVPEAVDQPHPVGDEVRAQRDQQPQLGDDLRGNLHRRQVGSMADGLGDDVGVTSIGLRLTPIGARHPVNRAPGHVPDGLRMRGQQRQQQPGRSTSDVDAPRDLTPERDDRSQGVEDHRLIVDHLPRPHGLPGAVDHAHPVMTLARIDTRPQTGPCCLQFSGHHPNLLVLGHHRSARGTPRRHLRKQRPERGSQSAARAPRRAGRPLPRSHQGQNTISHIRPTRAD